MHGGAHVGGAPSNTGTPSGAAYTPPRRRRSRLAGASVASRGLAIPPGAHADALGRTRPERAPIECTGAGAAEEDAERAWTSRPRACDAATLRLLPRRSPPSVGATAPAVCSDRPRGAAVAASTCKSGSAARGHPSCRSTTKGRRTPAPPRLPGRRRRPHPPGPVLALALLRHPWRGTCGAAETVCEVIKLNRLASISHPGCAFAVVRRSRAGSSRTVALVESDRSIPQASYPHRSGRSRGQDQPWPQPQQRPPRAGRPDRVTAISTPPLSSRKRRLRVTALGRRAHPRRHRYRRLQLGIPCCTCPLAPWAKHSDPPYAGRTQRRFP